MPNPNPDPPQHNMRKGGHNPPNTSKLRPAPPVGSNGPADPAEVDALCKYVVASLRTNTMLARGLRDLVKKSLADHEPGTEAHDWVLKLLEDLDRNDIAPRRQ